jgi:hypothetical protein
VRYDYEALNRKEGLAEQDRQEALKLARISGLRFKEETSRGYDIMTNEQMEGEATKIKMEQVNESGPVAIWNKVLMSATEND